MAVRYGLALNSNTIQTACWITEHKRSHWALEQLLVYEMFRYRVRYGFASGQGQAKMFGQTFILNLAKWTLVRLLTRITKNVLLSSDKYKFDKCTSTYLFRSSRSIRSDSCSRLWIQLDWDGIFCSSFCSWKSGKRMMFLSNNSAHTAPPTGCPEFSCHCWEDGCFWAKGILARRYCLPVRKHVQSLQRSW